MLADELQRSLEDLRGVVVEGGDVVAVEKEPLLGVRRMPASSNRPEIGSTTWSSAER